jgi:DUF4097 and DUF4098 domain-containing protein YvlB
MSAYPPPPPPYNPYTARAQARAQRQAARAQRRALILQARMQRRSQRRGSVLGPLLILSLGIVFLLAQLGHLSWAWSLDWFARWWPAVLIAAGLVLLLEWAIDQRRQAAGARSLGGGVIFLLIMLALAGLTIRAVQHGIALHDRAFGPDFSGLDHLLGEQRDAYDDLSFAVPSGTALTIHNPRGDVSVSGSSVDGQVHINVHKQVYAWHANDADRKERALEPVFSGIGQSRMLSVSPVEGGQADLTITVPPGSPLTINSGRGDLSVNQLNAAVALSANHGDLDINGIHGDVQANINDGDASLNLHSITGNVTIEGHSGDIDVADITGALKLHGEFFGTTHLQRVNGSVRFATSRTQFEAARLDGEFEVETGPDLQASNMLGPVALTTHDRNITLDRVQGSVQITNRNGTVAVTNAPPLAQITITNKKGSVEVGLPGNAAFVLNAVTRNGDMENDFGLTPQDQGETHTLRGTVGSGGPTVTIQTSDGDVTVSKSSVASLPATPPAPPTPPATPKLTTTPPPAPKTPGRITRTPTAPKGPPGVTTTF